MAASPDDRYSSATLLAYDLQNFEVLEKEFLNLMKFIY